MKGYEKYLPNKSEKKTVLIQAKIDESLHLQVKELMDSEDWTWHDLLEGLLAKLVDDARHKKSG